LIIQGASSVGKSALVESVLATVDPKDVEKFTRMTTNFLLYRSEPLARKVLVVFELPGTKDAAMTIRTGLSECKLKIGTVEKNTRTGQIGIRENEIDATGMVLITTTTRTKIDFELGTRVIVISLEHNPDLARKAYYLAIKESEETTEEMRIWQIADSLLQPVGVFIPYAHVIASCFPTDQERFLRDFKKILYLIKASALLHQYQRPKNEHGQVIATIDDYRIVYELQPLLFEAVFDPKVKEMLDIIFENGGKMSKGELQDILQISKWALNRRLAKAKEQELVEIEGRGRYATIIASGGINVLYPLLAPSEVEERKNIPLCTNAPRPENAEELYKKMVQPSLHHTAPTHQNKGVIV